MGILGVCLMGIVTVFLGLVCIIALCMAMSALCNPEKKDNDTAVEPVKPSSPQQVNQPREIPNRGELVAAVSAAIAEDIGTDVSGIRVVSLKPMNGAAQPAADVIPNRGELVAAVSAVIAEELGTSISGIRVVSLRKI